MTCSCWCIPSNQSIYRDKQQGEACVEGIAIRRGFGDGTHSRPAACSPKGAMERSSHAWHFALTLSSRNEFLTTKIFSGCETVNLLRNRTRFPKFSVQRLFVTIRFPHLFNSVLMARDGHQDRLAPNTQPVLSLQKRVKFRFDSSEAAQPR